MSPLPERRTLDWLTLRDLPAERVGAVAQTLLTLRPARPTLAIASLTGRAATLGRHQRAASTLQLDALARERITVARRAGGGRALALGEHCAALFLVVPPSGGLFDGIVTADRVLNRYVRGLLAALTPLVGAPGAHYFGRDVVSVRQRSAALLSQDGLEDGTVLFEAFVALDGDLALPAAWRHDGSTEMESERTTTQPWVSLAELRGAAVGFDELVERLVRGWSHKHEVEPHEIEAPDELSSAAAGRATPRGATEQMAVLPTEPSPPSWRTGGRREIPIGTCEGWILPNADGRIADARLVGEFLAPAFCIAALEASLVGAPVTLDFDEIGRRVNRAFAAPHAAALGVKSLDPFAQALLDACRAAAPPVVEP